ncbi:MAG TPA: DUF1786 family protein [Dehalococcoidia bacterium]|nr:DUF1786 family protein [Dehalococcoidia bacterium]
MKILAIDMGTGTQDILLFDSTQPVENSVKMVMPSATQIAAQRIRRATAGGTPLLLTGVIQGGGPCAWAIEDHLRAGLGAWATPDAARTFDDDLEQVERMGIRVVSADEAGALTGVEQVVLQDLDLPAIRAALAAFGVGPEIDGLAIACLDHGAASPGYSDRLFRFDHLRRVVSARNDLAAFAMLPEELPEYLTRARAMVETAQRQDAPEALVFLDTGPAAALGALEDPRVALEPAQLVLNLGNMHTLAFHLRGTQIISLYEHHTGELSREQVEDFTARLIDGTLRHEEVFDTKGHGVFYADVDGREPAPPLVAVTGPQRGKIRGSRLTPYFASPHGDMMISGCFGLLRAFAEKYPGHAEEIAAALAA